MWSCWIGADFELNFSYRITNPFGEHRAPSTSLNSETQWGPSNYQASPLSNAVLRSVASHPPTHPPLPPELAPVQSSLSNALGIPSQQTPLPSNQTYSSESSATFFNDFLESTLKEMGAQSNQTPANSHLVSEKGLRPPAPNSTHSSYARTSSSPTVVGYSTSPAPSPASTRAPQPNPLKLQQLQAPSFISVAPTPQNQRTYTGRPPVPEESPDPLALRPGQTAAYLNSSVRTPSRKRKSPSDAGPFGGDAQRQGIKRIHSSNPMQTAYVELRSPASSSKQRSIFGDNRAHSVGVQSATTHDYGDTSGSEYGFEAAEGDAEMLTFTPSSTVAGSTRKPKGAQGTERKTAAKRDDRGTSFTSFFVVDRVEAS